MGKASRFLFRRHASLQISEKGVLSHGLRLGGGWRAHACGSGASPNRRQRDHESAVRVPETAAPFYPPRRVWVNLLQIAKRSLRFASPRHHGCGRQRLSP